MTERSAASHRFCVHAASVSCSPDSRKIILTLGPLGVLSAHGTDFPLVGEQPRTTGPRHTLPWSRARKQTNAPCVYDPDHIHYTASSADSPSADSIKQPRKFVLVADTADEFRRWALLLETARARNIARWYRIEVPIGRGAAGDVFRASSLRHPSAHLAAVKRIEYHTAGRERDVARQLRRIQKEIQTQHKAATHSPYVVKILDVFFDSRYVYVVMEYVHGGSLREMIDRYGALSESPTITIIQQLCRCVLVMHQHHIVHRDIKADNCVLQLDTGHAPGGDEAATISGAKLTDFGFAEVCRGPNMATFCASFLGTASYMAPEIANFDDYGAPVDMFAIGVLCHVMLLGFFPFDEPSLIATLENIKKCQPDELRQSSDITNNAKSFCLALLNPDPLKRLTATAALQHRWLRRGKSVTSGVLAADSFDRSPRAWFRRVVTAIVISRRWNRQAAINPPQARKVSPELAAARLDMLRRLDKDMRAFEQHDVPRQSIDNSNLDDAEVLIDDENSKTFVHSRPKGSSASDCLVP
jgi:calcium/calmodulin-dependent protein kinase I